VGSSERVLRRACHRTCPTPKVYQVAVRDRPNEQPFQAAGTTGACASNKGKGCGFCRYPGVSSQSVLHAPATDGLSLRPEERGVVCLTCVTFKASHSACLGAILSEGSRRLSASINLRQERLPLKDNRSACDWYRAPLTDVQGVTSHARSAMIGKRRAKACARRMSTGLRRMSVRC